MSLKNATELLEKYPGIKPIKKGKLMDMCGDLIWYNDVGRIERVTHCIIKRYHRGNKVWHKLDIKDCVLIDAGVSVEEQII